MEEIVRRIGSVPGIIEVFLSDREGRLLAYHLREKRGEEEVAKATSILGRSIFGLEGIGEKVEEIELSFKKERVLIKNMDEGFLCLFCNPDINPALLRLSTGLQISDLKNRLQGRITLSQNPAEGDEKWWRILEEELKKVVGPIAGFVLEEKKRDSKEPLGASEKAEIVEELLKEIPSEEKKEEFKREVLQGAT